MQDVPSFSSRFSSCICSGNIDFYCDPSEEVIILFIFSFTCRRPAWLVSFVLLFYLSFLSFHFYSSFPFFSFFFSFCFYFFFFGSFLFFFASLLLYSFFLFPFSILFFLLLSFSFRTSLCFTSVFYYVAIFWFAICVTWNNKTFSCYFIYPAPLF